MLLTPHTLVGVAIASAIHNPIIAVPVAFGFHFLGDLVPHWDFYSKTTREQRVKGWRPVAVMAEMGLGIAVGMYFTLQALWVYHDSMQALNIFLCGIASVLPDVLTGPDIYFDKRLKMFRWIHTLQSKLQNQAKLPWGMLSQVAVVAFCLLMISNSAK
jgi:hypothetical protein